MRIYLLIFLFFFSIQANTQSNIAKSQNNDLHFNFNQNTKSADLEFSGKGFTFEKGIEGYGLTLNAIDEFSHLQLEKPSLNEQQDFSVQFWVNTTSDKPMVLLAQKDFPNKGILCQKNVGWALYTSGGTFGWTIGSGKRRLNYERDNGNLLPINDGQWHQITMTYEKSKSEIRLYYDGKQKAIYKIGFDFKNDQPLVIGTKPHTFDYKQEILPAIKEGAIHLQQLVDAFLQLGVDAVQEDEFLNLIVDPKELYIQKLDVPTVVKDSLRNEKSSKFDPIFTIKKGLNDNPFTVSQNHKLSQLKPIYKIYNLKNGIVRLNDFYAKKYTQAVQLHPAHFSIDELHISTKVLQPKEVKASFLKYQERKIDKAFERIDTLTVAVWNIWHGGIHFSTEKDGWDSRQQIAKILKSINADVVLMQETYSNGDYIAAELDFQMATSADWDYRFQGSNISVMSRFPIEAVYVPNEAEFMNVAAQLTLSPSQKIYAMSNWYGMSSFAKVFDFHKARFDNTDEISVLFGGDFNAIPHLDGGESEASIKLINNGFTDAYRSLHPNIKTFPGFTHEWGERIDQLYYKGKGLKNISTQVVHSAFSGFPSDHYLIVSKFVLEERQ